MSFKEWVDNYFECSVDLCDLSEDEVADLYETWKEEINNA